MMSSFSQYLKILITGKLVVLWTESDQASCKTAIEEIIASWGDATRAMTTNDAAFRYHLDYENPLVGHIGQDSFTVLRRRNYRNPLQISANGRFVKEKVGTTIQIRMDLQPITKILISVILIFSVLIAAAIATSAQESLPFIIFALLVPIVLIAVGVSLSRDDEEVLLRIIGQAVGSDIATSP